MSLSPSLLFSMLIFSCMFFLSISISKVSVIFVDFCRNCCYNSFFLSLVSSSWCVFSSLLFLKLWYKIKVAYCILCSASRILDSINIPVYDVLTGSLNILFKAFPCVFSVSFFFHFICIPILLSHILLLAWSKLQKVLIAPLSPPSRLDSSIL